jgi:hypothetical protein
MADQWESGRGRGIISGRGNQTSWRYNAIIPTGEKVQEEGDLEDTGTSPVKKPEEEMTDREFIDTTTKRRLMLNEPSDGCMVQDKSEVSAAMAVDITSPSTSPVVDIGKKERIKRSKKDGANSPSLGSADSREEFVREQ